MDITKAGAFIKSLRAEKGLTQKELAEKLGCTDKAVSRWETGIGLPDASLLLSLSELFGVSVNELLNGERYIVVNTDKAAQSEVYACDKDNTLTVAELVNKTDDTIIGVMQNKTDEIKKLKKSTIILFILCGLQVAVFFGLPSLYTLINPTADGAVFIVTATVVNSLLAGLLGTNLKWIYPAFMAAILLLVMPFAGNDAYVYGSVALCSAVGSALIIGICSVIKLLIVKIIKRMN